MAKYRILRGCHAEGFYPAGHPQAGNPIVYEPGEVIETNNCLLKHNSRPGTQGALGDKFQLVDDDRIQPTEKIKVKPVEEHVQEPSQPEDGLSGMSVPELKELARGDSIELGQAKTKADILKVIRDAYAATA
jgi:hypothetical protein